jgi:hypothetical protein
MSVVCSRESNAPGTFKVSKLFDRRARSKDLCASADTAIKKGDFGLAQRLLFQADIDAKAVRSRRPRSCAAGDL